MLTLKSHLICKWSSLSAINLEVFTSYGRVSFTTTTIRYIGLNNLDNSKRISWIARVWLDWNRRLNDKTSRHKICRSHDVLNRRDPVVWLWACPVGRSQVLGSWVNLREQTEMRWSRLHAQIWFCSYESTSVFSLESRLRSEFSLCTLKTFAVNVRTSNLAADRPCDQKMNTKGWKSELNNEVWITKRNWR